MCVRACMHAYVCTFMCECQASRCATHRLWDFDRDENYLLELSSVGQIPETAHVTFIDFNKLKGKRQLVL